MTFFLTVTWQVAVLAPSSVVTVIVAVPSWTAVTSPSEDTVATAVELDFQVTFWLEASAGVNTGFSCRVSPSVISIEVSDRATAVTGT